MTKKRIHLVFGWITALFLLIAGICLISGCVSIYRMGDRPFSPEAVAVAFSGICVPVYICLGLILAGWLLQLCCPVDKKKSNIPFYPMQLARLSAKLELSKLPDEGAKSELLSLRKKRQTHTVITWVLLALCGGIFLSYGLNPANFHQTEINRSMAMAMLLFFPCLAVPFGYGCFSSFYGLKLMKQEIALSRKLLREAPAEPAVKKERKLLALRLTILAAALFLVVLGFCTGGTADVLTKAINICTECVGLG